jgi:ribosomal protein L40E
MVDSNPLAIIVILLLVFVLIALASGRNSRKAARDSRICTSCGAGSPPFAQYCRRCGQRLKR